MMIDVDWNHLHLNIAIQDAALQALCGSLGLELLRREARARMKMR